MKYAKPGENVRLRLLHILDENIITKGDVLCNRDQPMPCTDIFEAEVKDKPEAIRPKILSGKIDAYLKEKILLEQPFIKNPDLTIADLVTGAIQKFGEKTEIRRFTRFSVLE